MDLHRRGDDRDAGQGPPDRQHRRHEAAADRSRARPGGGQRRELRGSHHVRDPPCRAEAKRGLELSRVLYARGPAVDHRALLPYQEFMGEHPAESEAQPIALDGRLHLRLRGVGRPRAGVGWLVPLVRSKWLYITNNVGLPNKITSPVYNFTEARDSTRASRSTSTRAWPCRATTAGSASASTSLSLPFRARTSATSSCWTSCPRPSPSSTGGTSSAPRSTGTATGWWPDVDPNDTKWDIDGDGLSDAVEVKLGSNPRSADTDGDGLADLQELRYNTSPTRCRHRRRRPHRSRRDQRLCPDLQGPARTRHQQPGDA